MYVHLRIPYCSTVLRRGLVSAGMASGFQSVVIDNGHAARVGAPAGALCSPVCRRSVQVYRGCDAPNQRTRRPRFCQLQRSFCEQQTKSRFTSKIIIVPGGFGVAFLIELASIGIASLIAAFAAASSSPTMARNCSKRHSLNLRQKEVPRWMALPMAMLSLRAW